MPVAKPSLDLLRELSDEHVLDALMAEPRLTRAELATRTGISKPTVAESIRRLVAAGVVVDTGERTTGRGRVGSYFALAADVGLALVVSIAPEGVTAELVDPYGAVIATTTEATHRPARPARVAAALLKACRAVQVQAGRTADGVTPQTRLAVVSAADPVDRHTGRLVQLPDAPFLLGELSPSDVLAPLVAGPVLVDNDVNWAALAEQSSAAPGTLNDFAYLFLGEGLGCAVVSDGDVRRGHAGLAGEIAHLLTAGPDGRACRFIDVFGQLHLRHPRSTAIDVEALIAAVSGTTARAVRTRGAIAHAVSGVVAAIVALSDPAVIVIGGSWGTEPAVLDAIVAESRALARQPSLRPASMTAGASLAGARARAITDLRRTITNYRSA